MLKCSNECFDICDFCLFFDFNGIDGVYDGHGVCWNPDHPKRVDPFDRCDDFICFSVLGDD